MPTSLRNIAIGGLPAVILSTVCFVHSYRLLVLFQLQVNYEFPECDRKLEDTRLIVNLKDV